MRKLEKILEENGISKEEIMDIALNPEFDMQWNSETGKRFRKTIVDIVSCIRVEDRWIPVEERLPENNEDVLVTTDVGLITFGYFSHGKWITNQEPDYPIAWRPLPEPYRPEGSE